MWSVNINPKRKWRINTGGAQTESIYVVWGGHDPPYLQTVVYAACGKVFGHQPLGFWTCMELRWNVCEVRANTLIKCAGMCICRSRGNKFLDGQGVHLPTLDPPSFAVALTKASNLLLLR